MYRIKELRTEKKIGQKELADYLGVGVSTLSQYETGKREPNNEALNKLAEFLNVSTDYLLGRSDIRRPGEIAAASSTVPYEDLPPEALEELEKYKELLRLKYGKK
jgi:transcriptional regulator with XRE-family HTH domain